MLAPAVVLADSGLTLPTDPVGLIGTFGWPTVGVLLFLRGDIYAKPVYGDMKTQRDEAIAGWRAQTDATNRLASAIEERNRIEELEAQRNASA